MDDTGDYKFEYDKSFNADGFHFRITLNGNIVFFPIQLDVNAANVLVKEVFYDDIVSLNYLYSEGLAEQRGSDLVIDYDYFISIPEDIRQALIMPSQYQGNLYVDSSSYVGSKSFNLKIALTYDRYGQIWNYEKIGYILKIGNTLFCIDSKTELIFQLVEQLNKMVSSSNIQDLYIALAKIKILCNEGNHYVSEYIQNQNLGFGEKLDIDVRSTGLNELELVPKFIELSEDQQNVIDKYPIVKRNYLEIDNNSRKRIFISDNGFNDYKKIKTQKTIKGNDYAKFIANPYQFIDEDINFDREKFSERVRGLKVVSYKAKPFVNANENEKLNWFEFTRGIELVSSDENIPNEIISIDEFNEMLENTETDNNLLLHDDKIVDFNRDDITKFLNASKKFEIEFCENKIEYANMRRVLDIYENVEELEYKQGAIEAILKIKSAKLDYYVQPDGLIAELYPYQKNGHLWLKSLEFLNVGGLLADDMGLGKTLQVISFMQYLKNKNCLSPTLVVLPIALIGNWQSEIERFSQNITCHIYHKSLGSTAINFQNSNIDVYLTTYETLVNKQMTLGMVQWNLLVCDEAQKIKNSSTYASSAAKAMKSKNRLALTGTPVENGLHELWSIIDYIQPGLLDSYSAFKNKYEIPIQKGNTIESNDMAQQLINQIKSVYLRRTKEEQLEGLPNIEHHTLFVEMTSVQHEMYKVILEMGRENPKLKLGLIVKLLQVCDYPLLDDDVASNNTFDLSLSNKMKVTIELLMEIRKNNEKVIVFTKYKKMQKILATYIMKEFGFYPLIINGDISCDRNEVIKQFSSVEGFNIIILSPRAAGMGLNITSANHVIHYSRDWNPAVEKQATDRVYRIGQNKNVHVYYPIVTYPNSETVEEKLDRLLKRKKILIEKVIIPSDLMKVNEDELLEVFD